MHIAWIINQALFFVFLISTPTSGDSIPQFYHRTEEVLNFFRGVARRLPGKARQVCSPPLKVCTAKFAIPFSTARNIPLPTCT